MEVVKTEKVSGVIKNREKSPEEIDAWISQDVRDARAGKVVEFGKHIPTQEDLDNEN